MRLRKATSVVSAIIHANQTATLTNGLWAINFAWEYLPSGALRPARNLSSITTSTDMVLIHNHATAASQIALASLVARLKLRERQSYHMLQLKHWASTMVTAGTR